MSFLKKFLKGMLGMDDSAAKAARQQARIAEEQLRITQENQKLQAENELQSVTQIAEDPLMLMNPDSTRRRNKRTAGQAVSNLGLNV